MAGAHCFVTVRIFSPRAAGGSQRSTAYAQGRAMNRGGDTRGPAPEETSVIRAVGCKKESEDQFIAKGSNRRSGTLGVRIGCQSVATLVGHFARKNRGFQKLSPLKQ
jgi:hypothetical protein